MSDTTANAPRGAFTFVLHGHLPYVLTHGTWPHGSDMLFECAAESYLPLLQIFDKLVAEGVSPKVTMGLTPVLVEQLADPAFKDQFAAYLEERSRLAAENRDAFSRENQSRLADLAGRRVGIDQPSSRGARNDLYLRQVGQQDRHLLVEAFGKGSVGSIPGGSEWQQRQRMRRVRQGRCRLPGRA